MYKKGYFLIIIAALLFSRGEVVIAILTAGLIRILLIMNAVCERFNRNPSALSISTRYDFYPFYEGALTLEAVNRGLDDFQSHYNVITIKWRPHDSLDLATPFEYYQNLAKATDLSHRY